MLKEEYTYFSLPENVFDSVEFKQLPPAYQVVYFTLCRLARQYGNKKTGFFFHSLNSIAYMAHLDRKTVINAKKRLKTLDFIEVMRGKKLSNNMRSSDCYKINGLKMIVEKKKT